MKSDLLNFAKELLANGFRVWHHPTRPTYLFVAIDGKLGYVQEEIGVGHSYTTVHVPNASTGTGFRYGDGDLTVETMRNCCNCYAPEWWRNGGNVQKWNFDKWLKANPNLVELK